MVDPAPAALLSLHPRFAEALLAGDKCVELRRRRPRLPEGTKLWFYSKVPVASVVGVGTVRDVVTDCPHAVWERFSQCAGVSSGAFEAYLGGAVACSAIRFSDIAAVATPLPLDELRGFQPGFRPPQFFQWLSGDALLQALAHTRLRPPILSCDH